MLLGFLLGGLALAPGARAAAPEFNGATPLQWSVRFAHDQMARSGDSLDYGQGPHAKWDYAAALFARSLVRLGETTGDAAMTRYGEKIVTSFLTPEGGIRGYKFDDLSLDNIDPGKLVLALYARTGSPRDRAVAELLRRQLAQQPRTADGGFWHKKRYPHQMWLDGLYMAEPFFAAYGKVFNEPADFTAVAQQFELADRHTYDPSTGLFYHGWDETRTQPWADKKTGHSPSFWSRAIGWYAMGLVDSLDYFPPDQPQRPALIALFNRVCTGIVKYQDPASGLWWQVTDQGGRAGNYLEASASAMFVYALAKGVNRGYLPAAAYLPAIRRGYAGLTGRLIKIGPDGRANLTQCCEVAGLGYGRSGAYEYYLSEPVVTNDFKAVGPFILAGIELDTLFKSAK